MASDTVQNNRILAVVNPVSGSFRYERTVRDLESAAKKLGVSLDVVLTQEDLDGFEAVRSRSGHYDCYLAVGGDGTVMEVAAACIEDQIPLAVIPRGTANATAWHFLLPLDAGQGLKVAAKGEVLHIDVARTTSRDFIIMAGMGLDAHIIEGATRELKRRVGFLAYLFSAAKGLGRRRHVFSINLDDRPVMRLSGVAAAVLNLGTLAGSFRPFREVSARDGLLDVVVVSPENFGDFFRMLFRGLFGRLRDDPRVKHFQAQRVRIVCRPKAPLEIDGDLIGEQNELQAAILKRALPIMVPPEGMAWFPWLPDRAGPGAGFPWGRGARETEDDLESAKPKTPAVLDRE